MLMREMALSGISPPPELRDGKTLGWWDWQRGTTIDTSNYVNSWTDRLNGVALVQASAGAQPLKGNGIVFDGSSDYLKTGAITLNQPATIYFALKQITWADAKFIMDGNTIASFAWYQRGTIPNIRQLAGTVLDGNVTSIIGASEVHTVLFNGASSTNQVNNRARTLGNAGVSGSGGAITIGAGGTGGGGSFCNMVIFDIIVRTQADSVTVQDKIKKFLAQKNRIIL